MFAQFFSSSGAVFQRRIPSFIKVDHTISDLPFNFYLNFHFFPKVCTRRISTVADVVVVVVVVECRKGTSC